MKLTPIAACLLAVVFASGCARSTVRTAPVDPPGEREAAHYRGPVIDVHTHVFFEGDGGVEARDASPAGLLAQVRAGGDVRAGAIVMATSPGIEETRHKNDRLATLVAQEPGLLFAVGTVHPDDGEAALAELERIEGLGFRMLKLHPNAQRLDLTSPAVDAVLAKAAALHLPVLLDYSGAFGAADIGPYVMLAAKHPDAKLILAHMGGTRFHDALLLAALRQYAWYRNNIWVDLSATAHLYARSPYREQLVWVIRQIGVDRVLFGSDFPFATTTAEARGDVEALGLTADEERRIFYDNAAELLEGSRLLTPHLRP